MGLEYFGYGIPGIIALLLLAWRYQSTRADTYGSADWLTIWKAYEKRLFKRGALLVGGWAGARGLGVHYDGTHAVTFGASGSGKGTCAILPNLLSYPYIFLVDPGGENTAVAARHWRQRGYEFGCINVFGMHAATPWALPAHGFNPLDFLNTEGMSFAADALLFAEMLTPRSGNESGSNSYFKDAAQTAKRAMIIHIKTTEPTARHNLASLYEYVNGDAASWESLLAAMKANTVCGGLVAREAIKLERIEAQAPEEFSAIMSTIQQDLSFLADPLVREKLSRSDVDFAVLKGLGKRAKGGVISVVLPLEYIESHAAITRLALACAVLELQRAPLAKDNVLFLIDEAAALGKLLRFPNWLATLRKYRVTIWSIWQNIGQLVHLYDKNWQTIIGNCGLLQILSVGDLETAEYTEKLLGRMTAESVSVNHKGERSRSQTARSLVTADELRRMDRGLQIAFIGNLSPAVLRKTPYWKQSALAGRFHPNPYFAGKTPGPGLGDLFAAIQTKILRVLIFWLAPHPVAACIVCAGIGLAGWALYRGGIV